MKIVTGLNSLTTPHMVLSLKMDAETKAIPSFFSTSISPILSFLHWAVPHRTLLHSSVHFTPSGELWILIHFPQFTLFTDLELYHGWKGICEIAWDCYIRCPEYSSYLAQLITSASHLNKRQRNTNRHITCFVSLLWEQTTAAQGICSSCSSCCTFVGFVIKWWLNKQLDFPGIHSNRSQCSAVVSVYESKRFPNPNVFMRLSDLGPVTVSQPNLKKKIIMYSSLSSLVKGQYKTVVDNKWNEINTYSNIKEPNQMPAFSRMNWIHSIIPVTECKTKKLIGHSPV